MTVRKRSLFRILRRHRRGIKVEAVDNIFFDINDANATITAAPTASFASISGTINMPSVFLNARAAVTLTVSKAARARF
jgi:hypothetical protein